MTSSRLIFLFFDGVGIGPDDAAVNPFLNADLPTLRDLAGGRIPTLGSTPARSPTAVVLPLDATLDTPGTPRSGTGQVALLTGINAAEVFGGHFGPWAPVRLRPVLEERSFLRLALDAGRTVTFANAYPPGWPGPRGGRRSAGVPLAALQAGVMTRHASDLTRGNAVASGIVNDGWRDVLGHSEVPVITPEGAGRNLARVAEGFDLTVYAHYDTDRAGHAGHMEPAVAALERVDRFLGGVVEAAGADVTILLASDHGNIEDIRGGHTRNPVLGMALGPGADAAPPLRSIMDVPAAVLRHLGVVAAG